jgi:hypothetical protein
MIADLIKQIGELVVDCIIQHTTVGEIDATLPESLNMKYKTLMIKGKEGGKDITNKIEFDTNMDNLTKEKASEMEWKMWRDAGGPDSKMVHYKVNPYKFARTQFSVYIDPNQIVSKSMGTDQLRKDRAFNLLLDPRVSPYVNVPEVIDEFILKEFVTGDPDRFKKTPEQMQQDAIAQQGGGQDMLGAVMGGSNLQK